MILSLWVCALIAICFAAPRAARGYAETHYRFMAGMSRVYRPCAEVYWDCPWRIRAGDTLPLVLIVKDAHRFPTILAVPQVTLTWDGGETKIALGGDADYPLDVRDPYWYTIYEVAIPRDARGWVQVAPTVFVTTGSNGRVVGVSSHDGFTNDPLRVYVSDDDLPIGEGWSYAETHCHSWQTSDQVEFGASPDMLARMARSVGLRWVFVTDHSFDLSVPVGKWFGRDPDSTRWKLLGGEIKAANTIDEGVTLIRGEEVSCGTAAGHNVHLLVYGVPEFIPGRGDGAKEGRWWQNAPDMSIAEVLAIARLHGGLAFPAHPFVSHSAMESVFLNRGEWSDKDLSHPFDGWEIWNTDAIDRFGVARREWIRLLLAGKRYAAVAGSDAHGDFNRTRAVGLPFLSVYEDQREAFGTPRTAVYTPDDTVESLYAGLRAGTCTMTNGPFADLSIDADGQRHRIGATIRGGSMTVRMSARSTDEFGELSRIVLYIGSVGASEEHRIIAERAGLTHDAELRLTLNAGAYVRLEAEATRGDAGTIALTNPIWVDDSPDRRS